ncbi:MAG: hypothetical protein AAF675_01185 [Pseudomonadota bacterium]
MLSPLKSDHLYFQLFGSFEVVTGTGLVVTPKSKKACAILAMLVLSPGGSRPRRWLQDKLWSASDEEKGAASLRQALIACRKAMAPLPDLLVADRETVRLDLRFVRTNIEADARDELTCGSALELLEGFPFLDEEFEDWLRLERAHWVERLERRPAFPVAATARPARAGPIAMPGAPPAHHRVVVSLWPNATSAEDGLASVAADLVGGQLAQCLTETELVRVLDNRAGGRTGDGQDCPDTIDMAVRFVGVSQGGRLVLRIVACAASTGEMSWSGEIVAEAAQMIEPLPGPIAEFVARARDGILAAALSRDGAEAAVASRMRASAEQQLLDLSDANLSRVEALLEQSYRLDPSAATLAWLSSVSAFRFGERHTDRAFLAEQARGRMALALEGGAQNAQVLALAAHVEAFVFRDLDRAAELSERAICINPRNPVCWDSAALIASYRDAPQEAMSAACRALTLGWHSPNRMLYESGACISFVAAQDFEAGIRHGETVLAANPTFKPMLRYLAGAHGHLGRRGRAVELMERLRVLEPDFDPGLIAEPGYPITNRRIARLLQDGMRAV